MKKPETTFQNFESYILFWKTKLNWKPSYKNKDDIFYLKLDDDSACNRITACASCEAKGDFIGAFFLKYQICPPDFIEFYYNIETKITYFTRFKNAKKHEKRIKESPADSVTPFRIDKAIKADNLEIFKDNNTYYEKIKKEIPKYLEYLTETNVKRKEKLRTKITEIECIETFISMKEKDELLKIINEENKLSKLKEENKEAYKNKCKEIANDLIKNENLKDLNNEEKIKLEKLKESIWRAPRSNIKNLVKSSKLIKKENNTNKTIRKNDGTKEIITENVDTDKTIQDNNSKNNLLKKNSEENKSISENANKIEPISENANKIEPISENADTSKSIKKNTDINKSITNLIKLYKIKLETIKSKKETFKTILISLIVPVVAFAINLAISSSSKSYLSNCSSK